MLGLRKLVEGVALATASASGTPCGCTPIGLATQVSQHPLLHLLGLGQEVEPRLAQAPSCLAEGGTSGLQRYRPLQLSCILADACSTIAAGLLLLIWIVLRTAVLGLTDVQSAT